MRQFHFLPLVVAAGILFFFLAACKDDPTTDTTRVDGQVMERQSRQPVGNGTVQVWLAGITGPVVRPPGR